jgi:hypothetical protein
MWKIDIIMQLYASQLALFTKYHSHHAKEDEVGGIGSISGEVKNRHKILFRKSERKRPCGGIIKIHFKGMEFEDVNFVQLFQNKKR